MGQPVALTPGRKMVCITSSGGDYSPGGPMHAYDFRETYLRTIFGFIGSTDMQFIDAGPMDITPAMREVAMTKAIGEARDLAAKHDWVVATPAPAIEHPAELKPKVIV